MVQQGTLRRSWYNGRGIVVEGEVESFYPTDAMEYGYLGAMRCHAIITL